MPRSTIVGIGLSFLVGIYAVMMGMANAPEWGLVVLAMVTGFYWAFGRRLVFPGDFNGKDGEGRPREARRERRADR